MAPSPSAELGHIQALGNSDCSILTACGWGNRGRLLGQPSVLAPIPRIAKGRREGADKGEEQLLRNTGSFLISFALLKLPPKWHYKGRDSLLGYQTNQTYIVTNFFLLYNLSLELIHQHLHDRALFFIRSSLFLKYINNCHLHTQWLFVVSLTLQNVLKSHIKLIVV